MAFLAGLGRAMTALGQDLGRTKREDEERQRQEEAAEVEAEQRRRAGRSSVGMRSGAIEPGTPGYSTAIDEISAAGGNPVSAMPEPNRFYAPVKTEAGWAQGSPSGDWQLAPDTFVPTSDDPTLRTVAGQLGSVTDNVWTGVEGAPMAELPEPDNKDFVRLGEDVIRGFVGSTDEQLDDEIRRTLGVGLETFRREQRKLYGVVPGSDSAREVKVPPWVLSSLQGNREGGMPEPSGNRDPSAPAFNDTIHSSLRADSTTLPAGLSQEEYDRLRTRYTDTQIRANYGR